jgi:hypothetical protein
MMLLLLLLFFEAASISAWGASWLNNTATQHFVSICTASVDSNRTSKNRPFSVKSELILPIVVVSKTTVVGSHQLVDEVSLGVFFAG